MTRIVIMISGNDKYLSIASNANDYNYFVNHRIYTLNALINIIGASLAK